MRHDAKKALLFAAILLGSILLLVMAVIFILARTGVLEGLDHL